MDKNTNLTEELRNLTAEELADVDGGLANLVGGVSPVSLGVYSAIRLVPKMPAGPYEWS
jgi:lactobin A/cerein 7B family class IIb bacteriocin